MYFLVCLQSESEWGRQPENQTKHESCQIFIRCLTLKTTSPMMPRCFQYVFTHCGFNAACTRSSDGRGSRSWTELCNWRTNTFSENIRVNLTSRKNIILTALERTVTTGLSPHEKSWDSLWTGVHIIVATLASLICYSWTVSRKLWVCLCWNQLQTADWDFPLF